MPHELYFVSLWARHVIANDYSKIIIVSRKSLKFYLNDWWFYWWRSHVATVNLLYYIKILNYISESLEYITIMMNNYVLNRNKLTQCRFDPFKYLIKRKFDLWPLFSENFYASMQSQVDSSRYSRMKIKNLVDKRRNKKKCFWRDSTQKCKFIEHQVKIYFFVLVTDCRRLKKLTSYESIKIQRLATSNS